jgi:hypothetical protein
MGSDLRKVIKEMAFGQSIIFENNIEFIKTREGIVTSKGEKWSISVLVEEFKNQKFKID